MEHRSIPTDAKVRFSNRADDYAKYRPHYPQELPALLEREMGLTPDWVVADIGSGTGISAHMMLKHGNTVYAVEPNAAMREQAEQWLGNDARLHSVAGSSEATTLRDHSADLIIIAQAFHWFDLIPTRKEFARILKPDGWVLVMWNNRLAAGSALSEEYEAMLNRYGTDYKLVRHRGLPLATIEQFFGSKVHTAVLPNPQTVNEAAFLGRLRSSSYIPAPQQPGHDELMNEAQSLFQRYQKNGLVILPHDTELYWGKLAK